MKKIQSKKNHPATGPHFELQWIHSTQPGLQLVTVQNHIDQTTHSVSLSYVSVLFPIYGYFSL